MLITALLGHNNSVLFSKSNMASGDLLASFPRFLSFDFCLVSGVLLVLSALFNQ